MTVTPELFALLDECVVQVRLDGKFCGTGFFVAPGRVLTCAHVLADRGQVVDDPKRIKLEWRPGKRLAICKVEAVPNQRGPADQFALPDVALLTVDDPPEHKQVLLAEGEPLHRGQLSARGFSRTSERAPDLGLESRTLTVAGPAAGPGCLHVTDGQVVIGMSGSPVIDERTGLVCGLVKASRDQRSALGGWIVTVTALDQHLPELRTLAGSTPNSQWQAILDRIHGRRPHSLMREDFSDIFTLLSRTHFTERPWLTNLIQAFLDSNPRGYFFVEGKSGVGKTTLAAELARRDSHPHYFCPAGESKTAVGTALRNLAAQLIDRYNLSQLGSPPGSREQSEPDEGRLPSMPRDEGSPSGFRMLLKEAAEVAAGLGEQLILIVDGLDRAETRIGELPLGLPVELPDNAYVIATLREGLLLDERRQPYAHVTINPYASEVLADIRRYIDSTLRLDGQLRARIEEKISADDFRESVVERCGGVWIYVQVVLADIRDGRASADALSELPTDLWTYYSRTLRELESGNYGDLCLPVLSTLACAGEPLPLATLLTLANVSTKHQEAVGDLVTGRLQPFIQTIGDEIDGPYMPLHDSARDFLTGQRPDSRMSGDRQRLHQLARTAVATHNRIADRYLTAWGGVDTGLPNLIADSRLGRLDGNYGLRHLTAHLEHADREDELHRLLSQYSWFVAHREQGMYAEYRSDLTRAGRLAAQQTDRALAAGSTAATIGREIRYALMDASVESISTAITPGLLRALIKYGIFAPEVAARYIRAVVDYPKRVEMVAALMQAQYRGENVSLLAESTAWRTWNLVFPPRSHRAWEVAGELLRRLPQPVRESIVDNLLKLGLDREFEGRGRLLGMLGSSLPDGDLERAIEVALTIERAPDETIAALIGLVPRLPDSLLPRIEQKPDFLFLAPGYPAFERIFALRLAASGHAASDWAIEHIMCEARKMIGGEGSEKESWRDDIGALLNGLDSARRAAELDKIVDHLRSEAAANKFPPLYRGEGAAFFSEQQVQRALTAARWLPKFDAPRAHALSWLVPGVPEGQRPAVVTEALEALPRQGSIGDYLRPQTLLALAPHVTEHNVSLARKLIRSLIKKNGSHLGSDDARLLAILAGRISDQRESAQLRREAVDIAARCAEPESIESIAPYLDYDTRLMALQIVPSIESGGVGNYNFRGRAFDALVAHVQGEEELKQFCSMAERIHDSLSRANALAGIAGQVTKNTRANLCGRIEKLVELADSREKAGPLIELACHLPDGVSERHRIMRSAAELIPVDRLGGDEQHISAHLAAVRPVLTPREIYDRLLSAIGDQNRTGRCLDVWIALTAEMSKAQLDKVIGAVRKTLNRVPEHKTAELIAIMARHLPESKIDSLREFAERRHAAYRAMPLAALVHRLDEPHRTRIIRQVLEDISPRKDGSVLGYLKPQTLTLLASAMTDVEREELIDIAVVQRGGEGGALTLLEALAELFPRLPDAQQARVMKAAIAAFPESFIVHGPDFRNIARHADVEFLQKMLDVARFSTDNCRVKAIVAVLGSPTAMRQSSWVAGGGRVGPLRELFSGLTRPGLLTVLGAAAPHIGIHGGLEAAEECVRAVEDVARWWP